MADSNVTGAAANETIAAISTPPGRSGVGLIRLSGPHSLQVVERLLLHPVAWQPRRAMLVRIGDPDGHLLDEGLATWFAGPHSYTGQEVVELALHGSPVVLQACLAQLCAHGARLAEPGEFSFRAFLNGKIDLPQAEAVRELIEARTLYQARVASQQLHGSVSRRLSGPKQELVDLIALLEAGIDFAENDVSVAPDAEIERRLERVAGAVGQLIDSFAYGRMVHDGVELAIVGRPNVGKSSLFNRLVGQERAIVTDIAGTTRDLVTEVAALDDLPVKFVDTAGVRASTDPVEGLGIERSYQAMADADLILVVIDLSLPLTDEDRAIIGRAQLGGRCLVVGNKCDLPARAMAISGVVPVSAATGEGIPALREIIRGALTGDTVPSPEEGFITSLRQEQLLRACRGHLAAAHEAVSQRIPHEMLLLDLYEALGKLDTITGATTVDDILNRIFATFCIGK